MRAWQTCQRGWWLGYYRQLRRKYDLPKLPTIGTFFHGGLERYYKGEDPDPVAFTMEQMAHLIADYPDYADVITESGEMAAIMLEGYFDWLEDTGADENLEVVGAEETVQVEVGPFILRG